MMMSGAPRISGLVHVQPLGSGGNADVYLYEQQSPRMPVAVKVLRRPAGSDAVSRQAVQEFLDEADTMAALGDHPYIVQVFRAGTAEDGRPYLVMKYYPPPNLAQRSRTERFPVGDVLRTGIQLASAVQTAHQARIVHRDIKPANVLISAYGAPGLTDFGIAGRGLAGERGFSGREEMGVSVPWAAPEVVFGETDGDERADIYSLAATLWQLLTGRSPFETPGGDNTAYGLMPRIRSRPVPPTGRADVPASLERLLAQAMAKDPAHRPASALEFARGLQAVEQELRLPRTQILVLDDRGRATLLQQRPGAGPAAPGTSGGPGAAGSAGTAGDSAAEHTHVKGPQRVAAQGPAAPQSPSAPRAVLGPGMPPAPPPVLPPAGAVPPIAPTDTGAPSALTPAGVGPPGIGSPGIGSPGIAEQPAQWHPEAFRAPAQARPTESSPPGAWSPGALPAATPTAGAVPAAPPVLGTPGADETQVRPVRVSGGPGRDTSMLAKVIGGAAALALVGVGGWVVVSRAGGGAGPVPTPRPSTVAPTTDTSAIGDGVFVAPTLTAQGVPGAVRFAWTYEGPAARDTFRVQVGATEEAAKAATPTTLTSTGHEVAAAGGAGVCAIVAVVRAGQISPASTVVCATAG